MSEYIIFIDDLDVGVHADDKASLDIVYELVRKARDFNKTFSRNFCVILLLRSDISQIIEKNYADSGKIFSSYSIALDWYDSAKFSKNENDVLLKRFINKRITNCFIKNSVSFNQSAPWESLIKADFSEHNKSSFAVVLQSSFFRPRDFILFFNKLPERNLSLPINRDSFDELFIDLADGIFTESCNELSLHYAKDQMQVCEAAMRHFGRKYFKAKDFYTYVSNFRINVDPEELLKHFFYYSIVGNIDDTRTKVFFQHRDSPINQDIEFLVSTPIRNHFFRTELFH